MVVRSNFYMNRFTFCCFFVMHTSTFNSSEKWWSCEIHLKITGSELFTMLCPCAGCHQLYSLTKLISQKDKKWAWWLLLCFPPEAMFLKIFSLSLHTHTHVYICLCICRERFLCLERKRDLLCSLSFALEALLTGDTVCTEQNVLSTRRQTNPFTCHFATVTLIVYTCFFFAPLLFWTIYGIYIYAPCQQADQRCSPTMSKTGNISASGQGIIFPATCLSGSECSAGLMVCTRCQLCCGYAVHSSCFILGEGVSKTFPLCYCWGKIF